MCITSCGGRVCHWLCPCASESAVTALGGVEVFDFHEVGEFDFLDEELCDAVAGVDGAPAHAVVNQANLDLTAIIRVDGAGGVQDSDSVLRS